MKPEKIGYEIPDQGSGWVHDRLFRLLRASRTRRKRPVERDITLDHLIDLVQANNYCCAVSGIPFQFGIGRGVRQPFSPSLDRIDCTKGYVKGNVRVVCFIVNLAMSDWGEKPLLEMCRAVAERAGPHGPHQPQKWTASEERNSMKVEEPQPIP